MILYVSVSIDDLRSGRYRWQRPESCPQCGHPKLWGHGLIQRYFNRQSEPLYLKRWRCLNPKCRAILTCRPRSYWPRFQESIKAIFSALLYRVTHLKWPPWTPRQRGGHWLAKLIANARKNGLMRNNLYKTVSFYQAKNLSII